MKKFLFLIVVLFSYMANSCKESDTKKSECDMLSFSIGSNSSTAVIDKQNATISIEVVAGSDLTKISPNITVSDGATCEPNSNKETDFSKGAVKYTVTAEDGTKKVWTVSVSISTKSDAKILAFSFAEQTKPAVIEDGKVTIDVVGGTDLSKLKPQLSISAGASCVPAANSEVDFSKGPVNFTVTALDRTVKVWVVTVTKTLSKEAKILTFKIPDQMDSIGNKNTHTIYLQIKYGTDVSALKPAFTVSPGATVKPAIGEAVDFTKTGYVSYTVKAESGASVEWKVFVSPYTTPADNPNIQYVGRFDFSNPKLPKFWAPGTYIKAKFKGTACEVVVNDEVLWGNSHNYIEVVIDGNKLYRVQTTGTSNTIKVAQGLTDSEHTILVCKDTEAGIGRLEFVGFRCKELLPPDPLPTRKIECYGNSITCGSGIDQSAIKCDAAGANWYDQHNAYLSYGALTARSLNAQWQLSSVSGIGLIHSCCGNNATMPKIYDRINLAEGGGAWDFSKYIPDVVTICLGQNDGVQDSVAFCSAYVTFIQNIRAKYANANIILLTSPMADEALLKVMRNYISGVVANRNLAGDKKVTKFFFSRSFNSGCGGHPDMAEHVLISNELKAYIQQLTGW